MAEEKKNELIFSLHDNMTNELICSGNASIYIIKDGKKIVIANKKLTIFPTKVEIEEKYLREKLYIELLDNPAYKPSPFPDPNIATIPICFCRQSLIQSVRFIPKGTYIGIVKAYGSEMGILNSKEEVYLSNWEDETISIAKDQTITLKAFLFYNVEKGKKKSSNRFFLNNDDIENSYSENIYWAFTIVDNIAGFKTVINPNSSSSTDANNTTNQTNTSNNQTANTTDNNTNASNDSNNPNINNIIDIDTSALTRKIVNSNGEYLYPNQKQTNNTELIENIETLDKKLDYNLLKQCKIYKLMKLGKDITGHTINFKLSDVLSEELLNDSNFLDRFCIIFFAYTLEDKPQYYDNSDNVQSIELKIVANKYSMVFDGYNLELYENGKYIKNFEAKLMLDGKNIDHDSFPFMPLSEQKYIGLDDLYICKLSAFNKVNYVTNQVTDIAHKIMDSVKNNKISDNATTNNMPLDNATSNSIVLDNATTINTTNNNLNNANYSQDNDFLITHYMRTYMNMLSLSEPQYNTEKNSTKKNTDTGSNTKISINYIIDEKILHDKNIILQNLHQTNSSNDNGYTKIKNDMIKLNNSILLSSNNFKNLISMLNSQSDILVKFIYQPKYVIEVTRYKEVYNNKTISHMLGRYGATYGVFAVYVYYKGEQFLLDSVIDAYNSEQKKNKEKVIDKDNIIRTHIETINIFVNNPKNHDSIKTDMYKKDLQNKANYGTLIYGGYTMEPAGPDCITSNLKRRIPEGHYKGKLHKYEKQIDINKKHYKHLTMNLYSDMVSAERFILVHAGKRYIDDTTGCVLVSSLSYETGNEALTESKERKEILYNLYNSLTTGKELSRYINVVIRNKFGMFGE